MNDWREYPLEVVCPTIIDYRGKTPKKSSEGIKLVTAKVVKGGRINEEPAEYIAESYFDEWMRRGLPRLHDVVITTEAPLGEVGLIRASGRVALGQRIILLRGNAEIVDQRFLHLLLQTSTVQARIAARATGTTVLGIKQSELRRVLLPLPPLKEQRRIASIVGAYDDLIEVNLRRVAVLEAMARGLFEEWFVRFRFPGHENHKIIDTPDGPLPEGWEWQNFGSFASDVRDPVSPSDVLPETRYVGLEHIPRRSTTLDSYGRADEVGSLKLRFHRGDVLFGKIRPYFHKVAWVPCGGVASSDAIVFRAKKNNYRALTLLVASSDEFIAKAVQTSNGTKMPRANPAVLRAYKVASGGEVFARQFDEVAMPSIELAASLQAASEILAATRDLLLPRLISGELSVAVAERELEAAA